MTKQANIEVYWRPGCGFCMKALDFLESKNLNLTKYNIWEDASSKEEMTERSKGARTVPQIFIDGKPIGGCNEMLALEQEGKFDYLAHPQN